MLLGLLLVTGAAAQKPVVVGSKKFTESVVLGEIATQLAASTGAAAEHRRELGGTRILYEALLRGDIDAYPEYTGTIREELLPETKGGGPLEPALAAKGLKAVGPLGFDDTYAIGVPEALAKKLHLTRISDLAQHPELRLGFSHEFLDRQDGWPGLSARYGLSGFHPRGLEHALAYRAIATGQLDATDLYSTDAEIRQYHLRILEDDRHYFPRYQAVLLYRAELDTRAPEVIAAWHKLENAIPARAMIAMNAAVKLDGRPEAKVAAGFLAERFGLEATRASKGEGRAARLWRVTRQHLFLVGVSLLAALVLGLPLGVLAAKRRRLGEAVLGAVGIIQTIPSLALLVFMIPLLGIGTWPAIVALFLYSLLPIVRNTHAGLVGIPAELRDSARALGLSPWVTLFEIELPLASRAILAGIKTSAVIDIGTATLGALIGAGGYGEPILTGIRLDSAALILEGAIPAALMAVAAQLLFGLLEHWVVPRGLRLERGKA
jgi:osmoprotectant transport system permease protein